MFNVYLSIGGNLGDRLSNLKTCIELINARAGQVKLRSSIYETKAWGNEQQPDFLNMALMISTECSPGALLKQLQSIEKDLGRERLTHWGARTIDIDILFYGDEVIKTEVLTVPHPLLQDRMFVLKPLKEICPKFVHPILKKSVEVIYRECNDTLPVMKLNESL